MIAEADWIVALEASWFWNHYLWQTNTQITILGKRRQHQAWRTTTNLSHVLTHLLDVREGLDILLVFAKVQYGFLIINSNICHSQFSLKKVFFEAPCRLRLRVRRKRPKESTLLILQLQNQLQKRNMFNAYHPSVDGPKEKLIGRLTMVRAFTRKKEWNRLSTKR